MACEYGDRDNGILVDFFDIRGIAEQVIEVLETPDAFSALRRRAIWAISENYSRMAGLEQYRSLLNFDVSGPAASLCRAVENYPN